MRSTIWLQRRVFSSMVASSLLKRSASLVVRAYCTLINTLLKGLFSSWARLVAKVDSDSESAPRSPASSAAGGSELGFDGGLDMGREERACGSPAPGSSLVKVGRRALGRRCRRGRGASARRAP